MTKKYKQGDLVVFKSGAREGLSWVIQGNGDNPPKYLCQEYFDKNNALGESFWLNENDIIGYPKEGHTYNISKIEDSLDYFRRMIK